MKDVERKAKSGFLYKFAERAGAQGTSFVISMILARLLMPSDYGAVALVLVMITMCDVLIANGFGKALIANKKSDQLDFSTCFWFGIFLSAVLYTIIFVSAPFVADFYNIPILKPVVRVLGLKLWITGIACVQESYTSKHMMFRKFFFATLTGTLSSGLIALVMAYKGCGIWALVAQNLSRAVINTAVLWFTVGWRPGFMFDFGRLKKIYDFGWKLVVTGFIDTLYSQIRNLILGKKYSAADLAFYNKGCQFPFTGMSFVEPTINGVLFPALAQYQDNRDKMRSITRRIIKVSSYAVFPLMVGLAVMAKPLILLILTEKWAESIVYLQIGCLAMMFRPLQFINISVIMASGNSALLLKLDVLKKTIGVTLLIISMFYGVFWIAMSLAVTNMISVLINIAPNRALLGYGHRAQFGDVIKSLVMALIMGCCMYPLLFIGLNNGLTLLLQVITGIGSYLLLTKLFKDDSLEYIIHNFGSLAAGKMRKKDK